MLKVLFGNHSHFQLEIDKNIDKSRFSPEYGWYKSLDFSKYDLIVPITIWDYDLLRSFEKEYGDKYWIPSLVTTNVFDDKLQLNTDLCANGFSANVPEVILDDHHSFPYIVKRIHDENGHNSFIIKGLEEEAAASEFLNNAEYFRQACVTGRDEFAAHILMVDGVVKYHMTVHHRMADDIYVKGGGLGTAKPVESRCMDKSPHVDLFANILRKFSYNGLCCIDYKVDGETPKILEINPRLGYTVCWDINRLLGAYERLIRGRPEA